MASKGQPYRIAAEIEAYADVPVAEGAWRIAMAEAARIARGQS